MRVRTKFKNSLCDTFMRLALDTWDGIRESRQVNFQLKEETFTDLTMLTIKSRHGEQIRTKVFSKPEEGRNGADWEWWFKGTTGKWIGFRVQAKIINIQTDEFEHLHYQNPRTHTYQCDRLIQNALQGTNPRIPLYCFYINTDVADHLAKWHCGSVPFLKDLYGCSVVSAFTVKQLRVTNCKHLTDFQNTIKPWHCLVCCKNYGNSDFITNIQEYIKSNFSFDKGVVRELNVLIPPDFTTEKPPEYVLSILENEYAENIQPPDKEMDGVLIYTEGEKTGA